MKMRSFTAANMSEAMEMARIELGDDAVILRSDAQKGKGVTVTFGIDSKDEELFAPAEFAPPMLHFANDIEAKQASFAHHPLLMAMEELLKHHTVPAGIRQPILLKAEALNLPKTASFSNLQSAVEKTFSACFRFNPIALEGDQTRIILMGTPGCGKTITAAKLAARMVVDNQPVRVISTDAKRAGGVDQLQALTQILGIRLDTATSRSELKTLLQSYKQGERVIIDSAGCNPYDFQELKDLGEFARLQGIEPVLVCAAGTDANEATEIAGVFSFLDISRVMITRTDCARHYGSLLSLATAGNFAFSHATSSARAMGDFQAFTAKFLTELFVQYQRERMAA